MKKVALLLCLPLLVILAGCGAGNDAAAGSTTVITEEPTLPPSPQPGASAPCPYLDSSFVASANGQHVSAVRISTDQPPACFFYRPDGGLQLTVRVYSGDPGTATALVNQTAPIATSDPATEPAGWQGGSQTINSGAVYAVSKAGHAVIIITNQAQTIKAREVAVQAITDLGW